MAAVLTWQEDWTREEHVPGRRPPSAAGRERSASRARLAAVPPRTPVAPRPARADVARSVYRRRRLAVALAAAMVVGLVWTAAPAVAGQVASVLGGAPLAASGHRAPVRYVAQPGDTLWSVANKLAPGRDPRPIVDELAREQGGSVLWPGDVIVWRG